MSLKCASSPKRNSWGILPGSASRYGSSSLACSEPKISKEPRQTLGRSGHSVAYEQTIPTKWSNEPRQSSRRHENHIIRAFDRQAERGHVLERLMKEAIKLFVTCLDLRNGHQPVRQCRMLARFVAALDTVIWRMERLVAIFEGIEQAGMPNLVWLKHHPKTESTVGRNSLAWSTQHRNCHCTAKIRV